MATTSLWHIKGRLKDLIDYVENPEKTVSKDKCLQDFYNVFSYVSRPEATENGEYVSAINCLKEIALRQMILTKKQYGKDYGYIAWHGYQSFKPDEVTPQQAHEIGLKLAKEMWGDRFQIIVTTHLDKDHIHNHFAFNSVSFLDGGKYNYSNSERQRLRDVSDRICAEYGLSVIKNPRKAPSRPVWLDEKSGKPTRYNVYREDVREAANFSRNPFYMEDYLRRKGYITDFTGKHLRESIGRYACRSMNTSQGLIPLMRNGRRITLKEIWERTQDTETAEQKSPIRRKCRRTCEAGLNLSKRQVISIVFICTTAICWAFCRRKPPTAPQALISKKI